MDVQRKLKKILRETIATLCKNTLSYDSELCVEGLLGITLDGDNVFLVNVNEVLTNEDTPINSTEIHVGEGVYAKETRPPDSVEKRKQMLAYAVNIGSPHAEVDAPPLSNIGAKPDSADVQQISEENIKREEFESDDDIDQPEYISPQKVPVLQSNKNVTVEQVLSVPETKCTAEIVKMTEETHELIEIKSETGISNSSSASFSAIESVGRGEPHLSSQISPKCMAPPRNKRPVPVQLTIAPNPTSPIKENYSKCQDYDSILYQTGWAKRQKTSQIIEYPSAPVTDTTQAEQDTMPKGRNRRIPILASLNYAGPKTYTPMKDREGKYACHICGQKFQHNPSLHRHIRSHAGRYFPCPVCQASFSRADSLKRHIKQSHHDIIHQQSMAPIESEFCDNDSQCDGILIIDETKGGTSVTMENLC